MTSRLIQRLDRDILRCTDPLEQECLKAERAGALARHGQLNDARFALAGVRTQNLRQRTPRLAAWIALIEGQIEHFDSLTPQAAVKFLRAQTLAIAANEPGLQALALAWQATASFNASDFATMAQQLRQAIDLAPPQLHAAWARIGLVLADAYRFAGDDAASQRWYQRARTAAGKEGDVSMMSALLHNFAAMRAARIGLDDSFGRADAEEASRALLEADSSANYDGGVGTQALTAMVPVVRAQLLVVLGRFDEALSVFGAHMSVARAEGMAHREARFLADRAWCHLNRQRLQDAQRDAKLAEVALPAQFDADDRAATYARLARVCAALGRVSEAEIHQLRADDALAEHHGQQARVRQILDQALAGLPSA